MVRRRRVSVASPQHGAVLAMVLVCLLVVASIGALLLRVSLQEQQRLLVRDRQLQTLWLVESGVDRAMASLAASPDYAGETWQVSPEELDGRDSASVRIVAEPIEENRGAIRITVDASYSDNSQRRIVQRRVIDIEKPRTGEQ